MIHGKTFNYFSSFAEPYAKAKKQQEVPEEFWGAEGRTEGLPALCLGAQRPQAEYGGEEVPMLVSTTKPLGSSAFGGS